MSAHCALVRKRRLALGLPVAPQQLIRAVGVYRRSSPLLLFSIFALVDSGLTVLWVCVPEGLPASVIAAGRATKLIRPRRVENPPAHCCERTYGSAQGLPCHEHSEKTFAKRIAHVLAEMRDAI